MRQFFIIFVLFTASVLQAQTPLQISRFELINTAQPERLTQLEIEELMGADSRKDVLADGYLASKHVACLFDELGYRYTGGDYENDLIKFRLRMPPEYRDGKAGDKKYPLIVWFHGMGETGNDNTRHLAHMHHVIPLLTGEKSLQFFLIALQCPQHHRYWSTESVQESDIEDTPVAILSEIIDNLIVDFPVDKDSISLAGCSGGIYGETWFMKKRSDLIASAVYISHTGKEDTFPPADTKIPLYFFYGVDDPVADGKSIDAFVKKINDNGGMAFVKACESEVGDRHNSWRAAFVKYNAFEWMLRQRRK